MSPALTALLAFCAVVALGTALYTLVLGPSLNR